MRMPKQRGLAIAATTLALAGCRCELSLTTEGRPAGFSSPGATFSFVGLPGTQPRYHPRP